MQSSISAAAQIVSRMASERWLLAELADTVAEADIHEGAATALDKAYSAIMQLQPERTENGKD
jgi:hypothetical protein